MLRNMKSSKEIVIDTKRTDYCDLDLKQCEAKIMVNQFLKDQHSFIRERQTEGRYAKARGTMLWGDSNTGNQ